MVWNLILVEGVDNGVTTSGKKYRKLVNVRLHRWAGSVREASRNHSKPGQEKTFLRCKRPLPHRHAGPALCWSSPDTHILGLRALVTPSLSQLLNSLHPLCRKEEPCCLQDDPSTGSIPASDTWKQVGTLLTELGDVTAGSWGARGLRRDHSDEE